ncbi:MAG: hypothetical protein ACJAVV_001807 [Alphaproteobacteria bacterium]|jgi:uncharacterized protein (DUF58 family)
MIKHNWRRISKWIIAKRDSWLQKRIPSKNIIKLNISNTFILPSSFGWSCIGIIICLFVLGTNFQNNIILLLCYFLLAMVLLAVFHSYFFFVQHEVVFLDIAPDFENRQPYLPIQINSALDYNGGTLIFSVDDSLELRNSQHSMSQTIKMPLPKYRRGFYKCPKIKLVATYGFGLFKCWTHLTPKLDFYVYPAMHKSAMNLFRANSDAQLAHSSDSQYIISDDLQGIREHQITDPIHHVSWKHFAKGQGMLTKDFSENKGVSGWLRLSDLDHLDTEQALQCLCYQVQQLDKDQVQFGLDLGNTKILPHEGQAHLHKCLVQLAMYSPYHKRPALDKSPEHDTTKSSAAKLVTKLSGNKL